MDNKTKDAPVVEMSKNEIIDKTIGNIKENKFTIYFYSPLMNTPSGGVGVLLRTAKNLQDAGFNVKIVYETVQDKDASYKASYEAATKARKEGNTDAPKQIDVFHKFNPDWVEFDISDMKFLPLGDGSEIIFNDDSKENTTPLNTFPEDFLIIPEGFPNLMKNTAKSPCKRIVLAQSWMYVLTAMQAGEKWQHFGIDSVISISDAITKYLESIMPGLKIKSLKQGINREIFKVPKKLSKKKPIIAFHASRGPENKLKTFNIIKNFYAFYPHLNWIRFRELKDMDRETFAESLSECALYLYTDDIAGFGTAPLEAMACGTHVVGWNSFGGTEYTTAENGFWCNNGDIFQTSETLGTAVEKWLSGELDSKDIQESYENTLSRYTPEKEKETIINLLNEYKDERIEELESIREK